MGKKADIYVKPGFEGAVVRMPDRGGKIMPPHGALVPNVIFYQRRMADKDLVSITKTEFEKAEKAAQKTAGKDINQRFTKARETVEETQPVKPLKAASKAPAKEQ